MTTKPAAGFKCAQKGCPNRYTEVIGSDAAGGSGWGPKARKGADCLPCYYAGLLHHLDTGPELIEGNEQMMTEFIPSLAKMGWTWQDVKDSYARGAELR